MYIRGLELEERKLNRTRLVRNKRRGFNGETKIRSRVACGISFASMVTLVPLKEKSDLLG